MRFRNQYRRIPRLGNEICHCRRSTFSELVEPAKKEPGKFREFTKKNHLGFHLTEKITYQNKRLHKPPHGFVIVRKLAKDLDDHS